MRRRWAMVMVSWVLAATGMSHVTRVSGSGGLVAHEWGTFTSIAGADGRAVGWVPQSGPDDLPGFIRRIDCRAKSALVGTVRMETPVIYFYAPSAMSVDVAVSFRQGTITEWFPGPSHLSAETAVTDGLRGEMHWTGVQLRPGGPDAFPREHAPNHYYVARNTDAAPLQVGRDHERFLFYRGVGRLPPQIAVTVESNGQIVASHTRGEGLGDVILFENRDGATAFRALHTGADRAAFNPLQPEGEGGTPQVHLQKALVAHGLYPKEAKAMVESWSGSWFEQGTRLFYVMSHAAVDALLPLRISPAPSELKRVFVGRIEIVTAATLTEVKSALETGDERRLTPYGRFLDPIGRRLVAEAAGAQRVELEARLQRAAARWNVPTTCSAAVPRR
jgi:hypothetical protein